MAGFINLPPSNLGDANVYSYLYQMVEQMNYALQNLDTGTVRPNKDGTGTEIVYTSSDGKETAFDNETFNELRSLIIKTGDAVTTFSSSFTARVDGVEQDISNKLLDYATTSSVSGDISNAIESAVKRAGSETDGKITYVTNIIANNKSDLEGMISSNRTDLEGMIGGNKTALEGLISINTKGLEDLEGKVNSQKTDLEGQISANLTDSNTNFDNVRALIKTAQDTADNANTTATSASGLATSANTNASDALSKVLGASEAAQSANELAQSAQQAAQSANELANSANETAGQANTNAQKAITDAESAITAAGSAELNAKNYADGLKSGLEGAIETAKTEAITAAEESTNSEAYKKADGANTLASTANENAQNAMTAAGNAQSTADDAKNDASSALINTETNSKAIEELSLNMASNYFVTSQFGDYFEDFVTNFKFNSSGSEQQYTITEGLLNLQSGMANFDSWVKQTKSFTKNGILYYDSEQNKYIVGFAVGQISDDNLIVASDGTEYIDINRMPYLTTYENGRMVIWVNGEKVAYYSDGGMRIVKAEIINNLTIGDFMLSNEEDGLIISYVGSD